MGTDPSLAIVGVLGEHVGRRRRRRRKRARKKDLARAQLRLSHELRIRSSKDVRTAERIAFKQVQIANAVGWDFGPFDDYLCRSKPVERSKMSDKDSAPSPQPGKPTRRDGANDDGKPKPK